MCSELFPAITLHFLYFCWNFPAFLRHFDKFSDSLRTLCFQRLTINFIGFLPAALCRCNELANFHLALRKTFDALEKTFFLTEKLIRKTNRELFYSWFCCPGPREVRKCFQRLARYQRYWTRLISVVKYIEHESVYNVLYTWRLNT